MSEFAAFYTAGYASADREEAMRLGRWRALGAAGKADHAQQLLARAGLAPARVVEIGCGDGALLAELSDRGIGGELDGFELSPTAVEIARARPIARLGRVEEFDGAHVPAADGAYDLAILSHVLEHVPRPALLLREAVRLAPHVLLEVPLEDNRSARRPDKRAEAERIGHIQRFARADVEALLTGAGLQLRAALSDPLPLAHHTFFADTPRARVGATARWSARAAAWRLAPQAAEQAFTVHYAVLAARAAGSRSA